MADKVQLIKEEIERRINEYKNWIGYQTDSNYLELKELLQFIDSLPEEHNDDLDEEIERCWKEMFPNGWSDYTLLTLTYEEHKAYANHFAEWQKQQMMKDAVEGEVVYQIGSAEIAPTDIQYKVVSDRVYIPNVKLGDKVKIIICKNEQQ